MNREGGDSELLRIDYAKADIRIRATSDMERRYRVRCCAKEPWTVAWIEKYVTAQDVLYDIGANVGTFSLIAAVGQRASVVAFEPGYANFARLCENLDVNRCGDRVIPFPLPLSDSNGLVRFLYRTVEPGQSRHQLLDAAWPFKPQRKEHFQQAMCGVRLDDAAEWFGLPSPSHIKLDVDGAEMHVLRGAKRTLSKPTLRSLLVEVAAELSKEIRAVLTEAGFSIASAVHREHGPDYVVFAR